MRPAAVALLIRLAFVVAGSIASSGAAQEGGLASWQQVASARTLVLFDDPALADHALIVSGQAERALGELERLFGTVPEQVVVILAGGTDSYAAIAPPLPRPRVVIPALFPATPEIDLAVADPLYSLLLHELTHTVQLSFDDLPAGVAGLPRLGLVGEAVAPFPPGWLLEGLAVWVAASLTDSGGGVDARTRGVLHALALEGEWPNLADVSLLTHARWPGGEARYLLGGAFVAQLVERHGWESLLAALRESNAGWYAEPFAAAWQRAAGVPLEVEWDLLRERTAAEAARRRLEEPLPAPAALTRGGVASSVLAVDSRLGRVAWRPAGGGIVAAGLGFSPDGGLLLEGVERLLPAHIWPLTVEWAGPDRLLYTRLVREAGGSQARLFALELSSGRSTAVAGAQRARFPRFHADSGCLLFVEDVVPHGSRLQRSCAGQEPVTLYAAPAGAHLVGLAVSGTGRIAMSIWRAGSVDLALLDGDDLVWVTRDSGQDLDPVWLGEDELVFRSDRTGLFELYRVEPGANHLVRLSGSVGGVYSPAPYLGHVLASIVGGEGYDLAALALDGPAERMELELTPQEPEPLTRQQQGARGRVEPYDPLPSLVPFGWLPQLELAGESPPTLAVSASLLGQDDSGDHSYSLSAGWHPEASGPLGGAWAALRYDYRSVDAFDLFQATPPAGFGVRLGLLPQRSHLSAIGENAFGVSLEFWSRRQLGSWSTLVRSEFGVVNLRARSDLQAQGRFDLIASRRSVDLWGYGTRGPRLSGTLLWSPTGSGGAGAAWIDASYIFPPSPQLPLTTWLALRAGYRLPRPAPLPLGPWAAFVSAGVRDSVSVEWRYADGLLALERLTLEGEVHLAYDNSPAVAADISLWADAVVRYGAPISLGASVGIADEWWYRLGLRLPL